MSAGALAPTPALRSRSALFIELSLAGALLAALLGLSLGGSLDERWRLAARYTARFSFPLFLLAFTAGAWARLVPGEVTRALLRSRRGLGLGFATAHTVHLGALTAYSVLAGISPRPVALAAGGGAYLLMFAMAATSNDRAARRLGRAWSRLHTIGAWWLWSVFVLTYAGRIAGGSLFLVAQLALALAALGLRVAARRARPLAVPARE
jgi:methionine sulfoxide reductase heme-binding subunit